MSAISKDRRTSPVDEGIWWVEYVLRHKGAKHLRPATLDLHWAQYLFIDAAVFFITLIIVVTVFVIMLVKTALKVLQNEATTKVKKLKSQ